MRTRANNGKPWDNLDLDQLQQMFADDIPLSLMCDTLGRSASAVCSRLCTLNLLFYSSTSDAYHRVESWNTMKAVRAIEQEAPANEF